MKINDCLSFSRKIWISQEILSGVCMVCVHMYVCMCVCSPIHVHIHVQQRKWWAWKSTLEGFWSHSDNWILKSSEGKGHWPPKILKGPQSSPAETSRPRTSCYLSWPQSGREGWNWIIRSDSVHSKLGPAWGQRREEGNSKKTAMRWEQGCFWGAWLAFWWLGVLKALGTPTSNFHTLPRHTDDWEPFLIAGQVRGN